MARNMERVGYSSPEEPNDDLDTSTENLNAIFGNNEDSTEVRNAFAEAGFSDTSTNNEADTSNKSTSELTPTGPDFYSRFADRLTNSTAKVAAVLEALSAGAPARQEARAETMEAAKDTVKKVGRGALKGAKAVGLFTLGMTVLTAEKVVDGGMNARIKVKEIAMKARIRFAERAAYQEVRRRSQEDAFASYAPNIEATQNREENERMDAEYQAAQDKMIEDARKEAIKEDKVFDKNRAREEAIAQREADTRAEFEAYKAELLEKRAAALFRKQERKERRTEVIGNLKEKGSEVYGAAKRGAKRFGRAAVNVFKRTMSAGKAAAKAAVSAGAQAWSESSNPAPSN